MCDNHLNCETFEFDGGDCDTTTTCPEGSAPDCEGVCHPTEFIEDLSSNDACDEFLNCDAFNFDNGTCDTTANQA